ncbi:MAG: hypothetical protein HC941_08320 [Microcoleus sp. SU_5_3]|nr:hypothetical protein [Microcoleus sp. SU_5_3]
MLFGGKGRSHFRKIRTIALWDSEWYKSDRPFGYLGEGAIVLGKKKQLHYTQSFTRLL